MAVTSCASGLMLTFFFFFFAGHDSFLQVNEETALGQVEETTPFPLDLDEDTNTPMMVDESQIYEGSPTNVIEGVLGKSELDGQFMWTRARRSSKRPQGRHLNLSSRFFGSMTMRTAYTRRSSMRRTFLKYFQKSRRVTRFCLRLRTLARSLPPLQ